MDEQIDRVSDISGLVTALLILGLPLGALLWGMSLEYGLGDVVFVGASLMYAIGLGYGHWLNAEYMMLLHKRYGK